LVGLSILQVITGGQYGSEGKGAVTAWLARHHDGPVMTVRVAGPNAGHSAVGPAGPRGWDESMRGVVEPITMANPERSAWRWKLRQVPVAAVVRPDAELIIAAGSEVDPPVLLREVAMLDAAGYGVSQRLTLDSAATVITDEHKAREGAESDREGGGASLVGRIGSTGKGIGTARADRLMRTPGIMVEDRADAFIGLYIDDTRHMIDRALMGKGVLVQVEGTQGYGLGLHARRLGRPFYPYGTSSDCRAIDFLAMAGISPWGGRIERVEPWVVFRPYPIRVAGNSGPMWGETSWDRLELPPEYTTVTNKVRRVSQWDPYLVSAAIRANGGSEHVRLAMTMIDQIVPGVAGWTSTRIDGSDDANAVDSLETLVKQLEFYRQEVGAPIQLVGTGPDTMIDWGNR
jgi:adenylosuccinate synthase